MKDIRICFIGDSFVKGVGNPAQLGWVGRLCVMSQTVEKEITGYNLGVRMETSVDISHRWETECERRLPDHSSNTVVFSYGVNDTTRNNDGVRVATERSVQVTHDILSKASKKYQTVMIGPPPIDDVLQNKHIHILDSRYKKCCASLNIPYLSVFDTLLNEPIWLAEVSANDGAHPRAAGYALIADLVYEWSGWRTLLASSD